MKQIWRIMLALLPLASQVDARAQGLPANLSQHHHQAIQRHLQQHPSLRERSFTWQLRSPSPALPACAQPLNVSLLGKERAWGAVTLKLVCHDPAPGWTRTLAAYVQVEGRMAIARHPLRSGDAVSESDIEWQVGDLTRWSEGVVEDPTSLSGTALVRRVNAGAPIRLNDLRPIAVIRAGDFVSVGIRGRGFEIVTSGHALADAALGVTIRVKTLDGKILQGKAVSAGKIESNLD